MFNVSEQDVGNLTGFVNWDTWLHNCTKVSTSRYSVVCTKRTLELEKFVQNSSEEAGSTMLILAILLATIMVTMILSLGYYVRVLRKKLAAKEILLEKFSPEGVNTTTFDFDTNLLHGNRVNRP